MSFCPTKDIHSVYLDNELPEVYAKQYEAHVQNCPDCKKQLEIIRSLHVSLSADSKAISPDEHFLDGSYERLMLKMSYSKNAKKSAEKRYARPAFYIPIAAAASALLALLIPVRANKTDSAAGNVVASASAGSVSSPIVSFSASANNVSFDSGKNVVVSGNIHETVNSSRGQTINNQVLSDNLREINVLRPDFKEDTISIRITVPGMGDFPVFAEINVPRAVVSGKNE